MLAPTLVVILLLLAVVAAERLWSATPSWAPLDRGLLLLLPFLAAVALLTTIVVIHATPWWDFNAARLAPTISMFYGYHAYNLPDDGPVLCPHYPPLAILIFVPAYLASDPTLAILIASVCSAICFFLPLGVLWRIVPEPLVGTRRLLYAGLVIAFVLYSSWQVAVRSVTYSVGPDGAAIGFGALAVCCALVARQTGSTRWLTVAALAAACSVWTKQTLVVVPALLPLWGLFALGPLRWRFVALVGLFSFGLLGLFSLTFGFHRMWFNVIEIMRSSQWLDIDELARDHNYPWRLLWWSLNPLAVVIIAMLLGRRQQSRGAWLRDPAIPFLIIAATLAPICLLGRVKIGGDDHHYAPVLVFLAYGAMSAVLSAHERLGAAPATGASCLRVAVVVLCGLMAASLRDYGVRGAWRMPSVYGNQQHSSFELLRKQPGVYYFPWNPLSHLLAEGRLTHFSYGLMDRRISGHEISQAHFDRYRPDKFRVICITNSRLIESPAAQDWQFYLSTFIHKNDAYALRGWTCIDDH